MRIKSMKKSVYIALIILVSAIYIKSAHAQYCPGPGVPTQPEGCIPLQRYICECKLTDGPPLEPNYTFTIGTEAPNQYDAVHQATAQLMCYPNPQYYSAVVNCSPE